MRKELELMALIEQYLNNELNEADRAAFEQRLQTDVQLQNEVELQRDLMAGMQRLGLRQEIQQAYRKYRLGRDGWKWGLGSVLVLAAMLSALYFINANQEGHLAYELPELNELGTSEWSDADANLPYQFFTINPEKDTVVESDGGIVIAIPAGVFLDANGQPAKGNIQFEFKEALEAVSILTSGLSTTSNGRPLQTGGMFYLNARQDGVSLRMDDCKPLYVEVPATKENPDMMLFDGERMPDGGINWVNPKPQEDFLVPVDIFSLNFYPPGYLDSLRIWGYEADNKQWTDSVFYNAMCEYYMWPQVSEGVTEEYIHFGPFGVPTIAPAFDTVVEAIGFWGDMDSTVATTPAAELSSHCMGIQPSIIKAIWSERFQNTSIATKEFEERLVYIYQFCGGENYPEMLLGLYVNGINGPMYLLDSLIGSIGEHHSLSGQFREFAKQRKDRVPIGDALAKELGEYYILKRNAYQAAVAATHKKMADERNKLDKEASKKFQEEAKRKYADYQKEFDINLEEAYRQLGYKNPPPNATITVAITNPGWKNIDQYVAESTTERKSLDFTDTDGKTAKIAYEPLTVNVGSPERYEKLYVYLLTPELNSFIRMERTGDVFKENLNELLTYHVACIGYMDGQLYFAKEKDVTGPDELKIDLRKLDPKELDSQLNGLYPNVEKVMRQELDYQQFLVQYQQQKQKDAEASAFNSKINPVIFPCIPSYSRGEKLYTIHCASCHNIDGKLIGPGLRGMEQRWMATGSYQGVSGREWLKSWIRDWREPVNAGHPYSVDMTAFDGSAQTAFPQLTEEDLESLLMYIHQVPGQAREASTQGE